MRRVFRLLCVKGFASVRSTLAGVAETGSETAQRLEGFASVRGTLAGLAERGLNAPPLCKGRGTTKWWKGFASVRSTLANLAERSDAPDVGGQEGFPAPLVYFHPSPTLFVPRKRSKNFLASFRHRRYKSSAQLKAF